MPKLEQPRACRTHRRAKFRQMGVWGPLKRNNKSCLSYREQPQLHSLSSLNSRKPTGKTQLQAELSFDPVVSTVASC